MSQPGEYGHMLDDLIGCAGSWSGTYLLQMSADDPGASSETALVVTPVLADRFVRLDQTWTWQGQPQEGTLLVGHVPNGDVTGHWADTWHNGHSVMAMRGPARPGGALELRGTYPAPPDPDWGWRIRIEPGDPQLAILMFNVDPQGAEAPAVTARYTRSL